MALSQPKWSGFVASGPHVQTNSTEKNGKWKVERLCLPVLRWCRYTECFVVTLLLIYSLMNPEGWPKIHKLWPVGFFCLRQPFFPSRAMSKIRSCGSLTSGNQQLLAVKAEPEDDKVQELLKKQEDGPLVWSIC